MAKPIFILAFLLLIITLAISSNSFTIPLYNRVNYIGIPVQVGTPPQSIELLFDTGSSTTWVNAKDNPNCFKSLDSKEDLNKSSLDNDQIDVFIKSRKGPNGILPCSKYGLFDVEESKTSNLTSQSGLSVNYYDNTTVTGSLIRDTFKIGSKNDRSSYEIDQFEFGLGRNSNSSMGVFGMAIPPNRLITDVRSANFGKVMYTNENFIMELFKKNGLSRKLFSIWLDHKSDTGELNIGSIDEAKFTKPLVRMKFVNTERIGSPIERYEVVFSNLFLNLPKNKRDLSREQDDDDDDDDGDEDEDFIPFESQNTTKLYNIFEISDVYSDKYTTALIDTGSSLTYLPTPIYDALANALKDHYQVNDTFGKYLAVECGDGSNINNGTNDQLGFKFNQMIFNIPLKSFFIRDENENTGFHIAGGDVESVYDFKDNEDTKLCLLGIQPHPNNLTILGQGFLKSVYTVFDLDRMELAMAPAVYTKKNLIKEIKVDEKLDGVEDVLIDSKLSLTNELYDPKYEFIANTANGLYKVNGNTGTSLGLSWTFLSLNISVTIILVLYC